MSEMIRRELFPGVWLRAIHTQKFKSAYLSLTMLLPLEQENAAANALIPSVLRRGTRKNPDMESLSAALDELYGGAIEPLVRKKGETQCVGFLSSFLDDAYTLGGEKILEPAAALLGDLLLDPLTENGVFSAEYTESEKNNLLARIAAQVNDKRAFATHRMSQLMCENEAFGVDKLGDAPSVSAITPASLWERYQAVLQTACIEIFYCGSADPDRVEAALKSALAGLPVREDRIRPDCQVIASPGREPRFVTDSLNVSQGKLAMGFRTGGVSCLDPEYPALALCNAIFGGTTLSKLFMNVREKLSLAYYASFMLERRKGLIMVSSGIEFEKFEAARDEVLLQLEAVRRGEIEDWEMEGARRTLISGQLAVLDDHGRQEDYWLAQAVAGLDFGAADLVDRLETVTKEEVAAAARRLELDTIYFLKGKEA